MMGSSRGTSEVIGFVLVFSVVLAGIGAVHAVGFDTLSEMRDRERVASSERAFLVASGPLDEARSMRVERSVVLKLGDGRLGIESGPRLAIGANGTAGDFETGALAYRTDGTRVTYSSGGVLRADDGGSVLLREPAVACRPAADAAVLSVVTYRANRTGIDSDGPVEVIVRPVTTEVRRTDRVAVNVSPSFHADAWRRHLERTGWNRTASREYVCRADRVFVRRTTISVRFVA